MGLWYGVVLGLGGVPEVMMGIILISSLLLNRLFIMDCKETVRKFILGMYLVRICVESGRNLLEESESTFEIGGGCGIFVLPPPTPRVPLRKR